MQHLVTRFSCNLGLYNCACLDHLQVACWFFQREWELLTFLGCVIVLKNRKQREYQEHYVVNGLMRRVETSHLLYRLKHLPLYWHQNGEEFSHSRLFPKKQITDSVTYTLFCLFKTWYWWDHCTKIDCHWWFYVFGFSIISSLPWNSVHVCQTTQHSTIFPSESLNGSSLYHSVLP